MQIRESLLISRCYSLNAKKVRVLEVHLPLMVRLLQLDQFQFWWWESREIADVSVLVGNGCIFDDFCSTGPRQLLK